MTQSHVVQIGNRHSFPMHLLDAETLHTGDIPRLLEIVRQAATSPLGRSTVEFLCPETHPIVKDTLLFTIRQLLEERIPNVGRINIRILSSVGCALPLSCLDHNEAPPLVCFSIARLSCLSYAMALANVRYHGMEHDFAAWLHIERLMMDSGSEDNSARKLTVHGGLLETELIPHGYPWHYPLSFVTPIFHSFVRRSEQL